MPEIFFPEWREENKESRYPFADTASLRSLTGLALDADSFLDASLHPIGGRERQYLSQITTDGRTVTFTVGDISTPVLAVASFDPLDPSSVVEFHDTAGRPAGILVSDPIRLAAFQAWPVGVHSFLVAASEFAASCVSPMPQTGLTGVLLDDDTLLTGDIWLVGEDGVVLREDEGQLRVDIVGDPLFRRRLCQPRELFTTPRFIKTINGMPPDRRGDFKITVGSNNSSDPILRIYPSGDGLRIETVGQKLEGVI